MFFFSHEEIYCLDLVVQESKASEQNWKMFGRSSREGEGDKDGKGHRAMIPFKPFSKSPISGELPHPLYFTRTVCSQVSFKYQISDISGIFNPEERLWVGLGKQVAFSLFSS